MDGMAASRTHRPMAAPLGDAVTVRPMGKPGAMEYGDGGIPGKAGAGLKL
ncbi:hypothetical protein [Jhaorihella thermophila]|uniref:Uncharacterized protein n=1 Tax=Jhaorihella thermophila TaxID=488547 RepID=A0A1H5TV37_9RHOB|nr:hypothetical protein [Jhaorihella thermophila]SEF66656.1 hypothetical protein SAMN05421751_10340 [Jhaorihella thermophila]